MTVEIIKGAAVGFQQMSDRPTPDYDAVFDLLELAIRRVEAGRDAEGQAAFERAFALIQKLERERDELREKIQYVTGQLIEARCDDGAAPVEELARRAKKEIEELRADAERAKQDRQNWVSSWHEDTGRLRAEVARLKAERKTVCELATQGYLGGDYRDVLTQISDLTRDDAAMKGDK